MLDLITMSMFNAGEFFAWFVDNANYLFVFLFMVVESSFIPFPSEVVVPPAAYLACASPDSGMNIWLFFLPHLARFAVLSSTIIWLCG